MAAKKKAKKTTKKATEKPFENLVGVIPIIQTDPTANQNVASPLVYYSRSKTGVANAGLADFENISGKIWYITHIFLSIEAVSGDTYSINIQGADESVQLLYFNIANDRRIDMDYSEPLVFRDKIKIGFGPSGGGGDIYKLTLVGFVQNK
jgi:hypothetical protein